LNACKARLGMLALWHLPHYGVEQRITPSPLYTQGYAVRLRLRSWKYV